MLWHNTAYCAGGGVFLENYMAAALPGEVKA
jgi:hypothetical protein